MNQVDKNRPVSSIKHERDDQRDKKRKNDCQDFRNQFNTSSANFRLVNFVYNLSLELYSIITFYHQTTFPLFFLHHVHNSKKTCALADKYCRAADEIKEYQPTFIVKVKKNDGNTVNLIVECEDFDSDKSDNKEAKRHYLKDYWIPAANNLQKYGTWDLLEVRDIDQLESEILKKIGQFIGS